MFEAHRRFRHRSTCLGSESFMTWGEQKMPRIRALAGSEARVGSMACTAAARQSSAPSAFGVSDLGGSAERLQAKMFCQRIRGTSAFSSASPCLRV